MTPKAHPTEPLGLRLYRAASLVAKPLAEYALKRRLQSGKEDPARINERRGVAGVERPQGDLVWIHGASVGESLSILPLVKRLTERRPDLRFLVTTGTVTSARLMAQRLPREAVHQFIPLDHPAFVRSFIDYWRPTAALFVESEFWPNLITTAREKVPFMALVNGRVSPKSYQEWSQRKQAIRYVLSAFDLLIAQDQKNAERLQILAQREVLTFGNLKNAAPPLPVDQQDLDRLREQIGARPVWLAASTHPGEEETIILAHQQLSEKHPDVLTLLAPRHPERGPEVRELVCASGLSCALRSEDKPITDETGVYVADTLGELGLFYRISNISFVGGSVTEKGGHNPLEPARLGGAILHGPYTFNFVETYGEMRTAGGAALVRNERELTSAVSRLMADERTRLAMARTAQISAEASAERVLNEITELLLSRLQQNTAAK